MHLTTQCLVRWQGGHMFRCRVLRNIYLSSKIKYCSVLQSSNYTTSALYPQSGGSVQKEVSACVRRCEASTSPLELNRSQPFTYITVSYETVEGGGEEVVSSVRESEI